MQLEAVKQEFLFHCKYRKLSPKTVKNYEKQIGYFLRFLEQEKGITEIEQVEPRFIKEFLMNMSATGHTANYVNDLLKAYKVWFRYAYEEQYTPELLTKKIQNVKKPKVIIRTFSDQELKRMINYYSGHSFLEIRNKVMIMLFADTGIRLSELINLTGKQVKDEYIIIHGKGDKERVVPKSPQMSKWLIKYCVVREQYFQYKIIPENLFLSKNGKPLGSAIIDRIISEAGEGCNVSPDVRCSAHTFRHTYAQFQLRAGLDIYSLSRLLGHESIAITQTYLNGMKDADVLKQAERTSPLMNL